jgi:site-specific recombinase XerD
MSMHRALSPPLIKAYDLLAAQPIAATGLSEKERNLIVISAIADASGQEHVLSRFGDDVWDLRPFFEQSNAIESQKKIVWPDDCPAALVADCKAVLYAWFKRGFAGSRPPIARTISGVVVRSAVPLMRWLYALGVSRFDQISPIHVSNYIHLCKTELKLPPKAVYDRLRILDLLWVFSQETIYPLQRTPWGNSTLWRIAGLTGPGGADTTARTPVIPAEVQAKLFSYCEQVLREAPEVLSNRKPDWGDRDTELVRIRDAVLYIVSITSGMRNEEAIGIETQSWRTEWKNGVEFHWLSTVEHKTRKGKVEYLIPPVTIPALEILTEYAKPLQERLAKEIQRLESKNTTLSESERLVRLDKAKRDRKKLFLCLKGKNATHEARVQALSSDASADAFGRLAKAAGVDWNLLPHQCRRTYARMIVESKMGRRSLVFLKWQLKHSSMSMTQLYASNPLQDAAIFDEIFEEMITFKTDLIETWLDDRPLAGGAGRKITKLRAVAIKGREQLLAQTAAAIHIRATGHGWCLAEEKGCGGAGLYEATRCGDCKNSVIDETFKATWSGILEQQEELIKIVDAGPAVLQRAQNDLRIATQVMQDLGVAVSADGNSFDPDTNLKNDENE